MQLLCWCFMFYVCITCIMISDFHVDFLHSKSWFIGFTYSMDLITFKLNVWYSLKFNYMTINKQERHSLITRMNYSLSLLLVVHRMIPVYSYSVLISDSWGFNLTYFSLSVYSISRSHMLNWRRLVPLWPRHLRVLY